MSSIMKITINTVSSQSKNYLVLSAPRCIAASVGFSVLLFILIGSSPAKADVPGFWKCWWARDLEGSGSSFTGGCWDANMMVPMSPGVEKRLKVFQSDYQKERRALQTRFKKDAGSIPVQNQ